MAGLLMQYVQPLHDWLNQLTGEPATTLAAAQRWEDAARTLGALSETITHARANLHDLDGRMIRALRERHQDLAVVVEDATQWADATGAALRLGSAVVEATRSFLCDTLVQLGRLSEHVLTFTLDPFEMADRVRDFARTASDVVEAAGRLVLNLIEAMYRLAELLSQLIPVIDAVLRRLQTLVAQVLPAGNAILGVAVLGPLGGAAGFVLGGAAQNFLQRSTDVEELDPGSLTIEQQQAWATSQSLTRVASLSDLVSVNGTTDAMGVADATTIDIKKIRGADGGERWIVSLPSTQDWQLGPDTGAVNDRDSNVALMMDNAAARTVYERAVLEAMSDAGIPRGSDVVLTGFSQGGIMAANLASDRTFPYNTVGVVTNGSPIDSFDIPSNIPVYAFQHVTDLVPALDGNVFDSTPANVHRVLLPGTPSPVDAHNNALYTKSVAEWEAQYVRTHKGAPPGSEVFMGDVVDHSVFTTRE
ncbi:hypothetical protein ACIPVB_13005 [Microbacterium sp. NPDC090007]|uniref:hypothetical protein n=1 Tax=Microbacterium sp. NPDC090007 TaxID=3364204 RepID=UPI003821C759